jgi:APA family basic amino acid/polyamine antiporter
MEKGVFAREATGLVRELGFLEHFTINGNALPFLSITFTAWYVWVAVPGGDPIIATILAFVLTAFVILSFALTTATFPRSAAPYVAQSRVLHPAIGWPAEVLMWFSQIVGIALFTGMVLFWAVGPGLYAMGVSSGNQGLINAAYAIIDPVWTIVFGTIILALVCLVSIAGIKFLARAFNIPLIVLMYLAVIVFIVVLAGSTREQFINLTPKYLNQSYDTIIATARESYPSMMVPPSFGAYALLAAAGLCAGSVNTYWNAWAAGEVKRAGAVRMQVLSMMIPSIVAAVISLTAFTLAYNVVGRDFLLALTQVMTYNVGMLKAPFFTAMAAVTFVPLMLADNVYIQLLLTIGYAAAALAFLPYAVLLLTRDVFAWAFDRLLPSRFADVSERWHTPVFNIVFNFVLVWVLLVIFTYFGSYMPFFFATGWDTSLIEVTVLCLAAMVLPLRKRLWDLSPAKKYTVGGIPVVSIAGAIGAFYSFVAVWIFSTAPALGFGLASLSIIIVIAVIPFVLYWIIRAVRRRQGIDLDLVFADVPPE